MTFSWQLRVGADGAWLPTMVQVSVSLRTGEIRLYSRRAMPYAGPTTPQVTAEEARARAVAAVSGDRQYANATAGTPVLQVVGPYAINADQAEPRLVWVVPFAGMREGIYIDALTGERIPTSPVG